jgi:hypothetical protein
MSAKADMLASSTTPDKVETRIGTLEFDDGAPSEATAALLYDNLDFLHGVEAFLGAIPGVSLTAMRRGFLSAGVEDNSFTLFSELMDSASLFLTGNCDTVYFWGFLDLSDGPMVIDVPSIAAPSGILGTIDDMWFKWVTDIGLPGPDRGAGGRYLIVGPGYDGPLPDSGFHVFHARTTRVTVIGRAFMIDNDPTAPVEVIREGFRPLRARDSTGALSSGRARRRPARARPSAASAVSSIDATSRTRPTCKRTSRRVASRVRVASLPLLTSGRERVDEVGRLLVRCRDRHSFCGCSLRQAHLRDELLHLVA